MELNTHQQIVKDTFINKQLCFVNASAGTGKTTTLIQSYIALLEKKERVEDIVVITFTKAAANEMLIRIRGEIRLKIKEEIDTQKKLYWNSVYESVLSSSNITTIHAFAQKIVSENALYLGLPSSINILEEDNDFVDNLHHVIEKLLEKSAHGRLLYSLYNLYIIDNRNKFIENILSFINSIKPRLEDIKTFENKVHELIGGTECYNETMKELTSRDIDFCINYDNPTGNNKIELAKPILQELKNIFDSVYNKSNAEIDELKKLYKIVKEFNNYKVGNTKKDFGDEFKAIKSITEKLSSLLEPMCYKNEIDAFLSFIKEAYIKIEDNKKRAGVYSHDDIISIAISALEDEKLKNKIRDSVKSIILDEAQDTSSLQFNFINLIIFGKREIDNNDIKNIGNKRLFIVGDRKQSIYRFRDANVEEFLRIEEKFKGLNAVLKDNYRSNNNLISFFNHLFANYVFNEDQIKYNDNDNLIGHRESTEKSVHLLALNHNTREGDKIRAPEGRTLESNAIASFVSSKLNNEYKDTAILLRGFSKLDVYLDALSKQSVPFYVEGGRGFYQRIEITEIMSFLYYLFLFEIDSLDLLLTFPFFDISIDEIFKLKNSLGESKLKINDYISIYKENTIEGIKAKTIASDMPFFDKLESIKKIINSFESTIHFSTAYQIIEDICVSTNYYSHLGRKVDAELSIANVEKLKDIAKDYEHSTGKTAYDFVVYVKKLNDNSVALCQVPKLDIDSLRIMTIHKSKGLEFKNTIFASTGSTVNNTNPQFYFIDNKPVITLPISKTDKIIFPQYDKDEAKLKDESEKKRLLYVALTRASNNLILSGESANKTTYRAMFDSFFSVDIANTKIALENKSEDMKDIVLDKDFNNDKANLYIYGRGIKHRNENNNDIAIEYEDNNIDNTIEKESAKESSVKQIHINIASGSNNNNFEHIYNLESLMDSKPAYFNDEENLIYEDEYSYKEESNIKPSPSDLGSSIHFILENFDFEYYKKNSSEYILAIVEEALLSFIGYDKEYVRSIILQSIDNYLKDIHIKNILDGIEEIVLREGSFQSTVKDNTFNINIMKGKVDLITKDKNGNYFVIDYKVASKNSSNENNYLKQINTYKSLIAKAWKINEKKIFTHLMYLK